MTNGEAVNWIINISADIGKAEHRDLWHYEQALSEIRELLEVAQPVAKDTNVPNNDCISRQAAIDVLNINRNPVFHDSVDYEGAMYDICKLPSAQPERKWMPCSNPPKHHKDVIVKGIEAIGNVTVHKVMQWDVDTWRPTDYAPSVMWKEWSEI